MNEKSLGLSRSVEQWAKCDPEKMATCQSTTAVTYAIKDARHDLLACFRRIYQLERMESNEAIATKLADALFENACDRLPGFGPARRIAFMHGQPEKMGCGMNKAALTLFLRNELKRLNDEPHR